MSVTCGVSGTDRDFCTCETCGARGRGDTRQLVGPLAQRDELLAALKALVREVEDKDNPRDEGCSEHCDEMIAARAAIAKAEGHA